MEKTTIGKYINLEKLGAGGMAEVFIGDDPGLDRKVAIKLILPHLATAGDFEERFRREAKTVAALRHPNIIQIYEYAIEDSSPYMVMEYLEKGALEEYLAELQEKGEIMPLDEAESLLAKIASGLDYAHKRDLIHRDIKPSNILLSEDGEPIIADFGIVKMLNESVVLTQTGGVVGSPRYLPPEQATDAPVDHRSDIYSLGIMVYQMVTGRVPFDGDLIQIMMQHVNEQPPNPSEINPNISESVSRVILQALAKDPADRFSSAGEFAAAFKAALAFDTEPKPKPIVVSTAAEKSSKPVEGVPMKEMSAKENVGRKVLGMPTPVFIGVVGLLVVGLLIGSYFIFGSNDGDSAGSGILQATPPAQEFVTVIAPEGFDIQGEWTFKMYQNGSNSEYDQGVITFSEASRGTYGVVDYYGYEYTGGFVLDGGNIEIDYNNWVGIVEDNDTISGTWVDNDTFGTFFIVRK